MTNTSSTTCYWYPVWVVDDYHCVSSLTCDEMQKWCVKNCKDQWTSIWVQSYLAFWFVNEEDQLLFKLVWQ